MKKLYFILIISWSCFLTIAQTPEQQINDRMTYVFAQLNRSNVPTGILSNYGIQPIPLEYYNGVPADSNYVNLDSYKQLYAGLYSAKFNDAVAMISPADYAQQLDNYTYANATPVFLMHYHYSRLKENAVQLGLVNVVNDQIIETGAGSPYEILQLFVAAPKEVIFDGGVANFVFPSALWKTNVTKTVSNIQIKFDEQSDYVTATWDTPVSKRYTSNGVKKVYFKLNYTDGSSVISQTNIVVQNAIQILPRPYRVGSASAAAGVAGAEFNVSIAATAEHAGGTLQIKLSPTNTTGKIRKALIIAEGFDISPRLGISNNNLDSFLLIKTNIGSINYQYSNPNIYQQLQTEDYDIVYVDNANGIDDIKRNAALFRDALNWVNNPANKIGTYPNVVMGISMGGLVARYALRKMELAGTDHQTWKYITIDTPHKGANLPAGLQAMARHLLSLDIRRNGFPVFSVLYLKPAQEVLSVLNSTAAKQMLIYNVTASGTGFDNSVHDNFYNELNQMGLPVKTQNIAVTNGSLQDVNLFAPGAPIIACNEKLGLNWWQELTNIVIGSWAGAALMGNTNYGGAFILNLIPGKTQLSADFNVNGINNDNNAYLYFGRVRFYKKIFWLINSSVDLTNSSIKKQTGMLSIDGSAGGTETVNVNNSSVPTFISKYIKVNNICFIPRESSLAMTLKDGYTLRDITGQDLFQTNETDFEHFSGPSSYSEVHTTFGANNTFIINQLKDKPVYVNQYNPVFCGSQSVLLKNPMNRNLSWSATNGAATFSSVSNTAAIMSSGINNGIMNVFSENYYSLRRKIYNSCNLSISASSLLCDQDQVAFNIENLPSGATIQWSVYSPLEIISGQGTNSIVVRANTQPTSTGSGSTIFATLTLNGQSFTLTKDIQVGSPEPNYIDFEEPVYATIGTMLYSHFTGATNYTWQVMSGAAVIDVDLNDRSKAYVTPFGGGQTVTIRVTASNQCGSSYDEVSFTPEYYYDFLLSPNPAMNYTTISINNGNGKLMNSTEVASVSSMNLSNQKYEIQLWNSYGLIKAIKTDQNKYQLDLSGVTPGFYYVQVIKDSKTYRKQLIVK